MNAFIQNQSSAIDTKDRKNIIYLDKMNSKMEVQRLNEISNQDQLLIKNNNRKLEYNNLIHNKASSYDQYNLKNDRQLLNNLHNRDAIDSIVLEQNINS